MNTITVFRLEDSFGRGAFEALPWEACDKFQDAIPDYMAERPMPYNDGGTLADAAVDGTLHRDGGVRYGTPSVELLRHWFPPCLAPVIESEPSIQFTVWEVPAEDVFHGEHQVAFRPTRARCLERQPLSALYQGETLQ